MSIEAKRKELEIARISTARKEMEFKILEKQEEIVKLTANIENQLKRENELQAELKTLQSK